MDVFLLCIISAFVLFAVLLPLIGVCLGLFCYYLLPYVFGGFVALALLVVTGAKVFLALWLWLFALVWASAVLFVKMKFRKLGEEIEHYRAAHTLLLCGIPYRRKRNELREVLVTDAEF